MTNYADYAYYTSAYKGADIDTASFEKYARNASQMIRNHTFGNINETLTIPEEVKMCCCELAEHLHKQDILVNSSQGIASEKVGEYTISYVDSEKIKTQSIDEISTIINNWLLMTGLLYRGCY